MLAFLCFPSRNPEGRPSIDHLVLQNRNVRSFSGRTVGNNSIYGTPIAARNLAHKNKKNKNPREPKPGIHGDMEENQISLKKRLYYFP